MSASQTRNTSACRASEAARLSRILRRSSALRQRMDEALVTTDKLPEPAAGSNAESEGDCYSEARGAIDRQRANVMWVVESVEPGLLPADCAPAVPRRCHARGALERISWQRLPVE